MKTRDLIAALNTEDPSGELEVSVGNTDIHFVSREPAYYDGCLQVLKRNPKKTGNCYDVIGAEYRGNGSKIKIHTLSVREAIWNDPTLAVTFDGDYSKRNNETTVAEWRAEATSK